MKKARLWMMAAILLFCGISVLTSCSKDDDNTAPQLSDIWDAETGTLIVNSNPGKDAYRGRTDIKKLIISDGVTSIGDYAFHDCGIGVIDLPASVVSIGSNAFSGKGISIQMATVNAKNCVFGEKPFHWSIVTKIYVPAEALDEYKTKYPDYDKEILPIPEASRTGNVIVWSEALCQFTWATVLDDRNMTAHNTQGGITVTYTGTEEDNGLMRFGLHLLQGEKLTFTSAVGNISQITVQAIPLEDEEEEEEEEPYVPVAEGWTWDNEKNTFTWQGTPSEAVEMIAGNDVDMDRVQISFTVE